jgi:hypothetical protein
MAQAQQLSGAARYTAYGNLDIDISKNAAPWASRANGNERIFLSSRVGCFTYSAAYSELNYAGICLK